MTLYEKAIEFATAAHHGVTRRFTNEPYINHPLRVAARIALLTEDDEERAAAVLHDTVEDVAEITTEVIAAEFTPRVAELVGFLTDPPAQPGVNRRARKQLSNTRLSLAPAIVHDIKLADIIDNVPGIITHDPDFAKVYVPEKQASLSFLVHGTPALQVELRDLLDQYNSQAAL